MTARDQERLLEYALGQVLAEPARDGEVHAPEAAATDLSARIVDAWERGERGSATAAELVVEAEDRAPQQLRPVPGRGLNWRLAAGFVAACGLGIALWQLRTSAGVPFESGTPPHLATAPQPGPAPFAVASRPLLALATPGAPGAAPSTDLRAGARMTVPGTESVAVELAGGRLEFSPGSIFTLNAEQPALHLELGEVRATRLTQALEADFGFGLARLEPSSSLALRVEPDDGRFLDLPADTRGSAARAALLENGALRRRLKVDVRVGRVALQFEKQTVNLREPDAFVVLSPPTPGGEFGSVARIDREWIFERLALIAERARMDYGGSAATGRNLALERAHAADAELQAFLETTPAGWTLLHGLLIEATDEVPARRMSLLNFLAYSDSPHALRAARSIWARLPGSFSEDHLIAFAAAGGEEFAAEVRARVTVGLEAPGLALPSLRCAAYLARQGEDLGREVLRASLRAGRAAPPGADSGTATLVDEVLAARALEALGEAEFWPQVADRWARVALAALDEAGGTRDPKLLAKRNPGRSARWIATVLALSPERATRLPVWSAGALWETTADEWSAGPAALRTELEGYLRR